MSSAGTTAHGGESDRLIHTAALLGGFALASRVLGLLRDMTMAWLLGGGAAADALVAAMRLPHVARRLLGEGSLSMTLTASLTVFPQQSGKSAPLERRELITALTVQLGGIVGILTIVGWLTAPWITDVLAPGFSGAQYATTVDLLRVCWPYVPAAIMAALGMAVLHSLGVFWLPAFSPVLFNSVILGFAALAWCGMLPPTWAFAIGMTCGGLAQCLAQWLAVRSLLPPRPVRHTSKGQTNHPSPGQTAWCCLRRVPASLLGASAPQLALLLAMSLASGREQGLVAALYYGERLLELPLGLVGVGLGMASLPTLSRLAAQKDMTAFADTLSTALRLTVWIMLPAAVGLWTVGPQLVTGLLGHGAFDAHAVQTTGAVLQAYAFALPALALNRTLLAADNALMLPGHTAITGCVCLAITLIVGFLLPFSTGPALAVSAGVWAQTGFLMWSVERHCRTTYGCGTGTWQWLPGWIILLRQSAAAATTGGAAWLVLELLKEKGTAVAVAMAVAGGILAWGLSLWMFRDADMRTLGGFLQRQCQKCLKRLWGRHQAF